MPSKVLFSSSSSSALPANHPTDLIRHGKNHHHARQEAIKSGAPEHPTRGLNQQQQPHGPSPPAAPIQPARQERQVEFPDPKDAAEMIVNEERESKSKMPNHIGLEKFKLVEKMGEFVMLSCLIYHTLISSLQRCFLQCLQGH